MGCVFAKKRSIDRVIQNQLDADLEAVLKRSIQDFSFSFYKELLATTETGNMLYSPFGMYAIMFNASVGANSKTFDEIITTMNLDETTFSQRVYSLLLEKLTSENNNLKMTTGMFVDSNFKIKNSFIKTSTGDLKSSVEKLEINNDVETKRQYINCWVLEKTYCKTNELFPKGSITEVNFLLVNDVHFTSAWEYRFKNIMDDSFYVTPSDKITVKMMVIKRFFRYYHDVDLKFAALELPYEHDKFKMIVILPDELDGLRNIEDNFSKINVYEISTKMSGYHVNVKFPRFKLEQSLQTKEILSNLGCPTMFTPQADFSNVVDCGNLYASSIVHTSRVEVNANGTENAISTGIRFVQYNPRRLQPKVNFVADRPFIFFIISGAETVVLFMGRVSQPTKVL